MNIALNGLFTKTSLPKLGGLIPSIVMEVKDLQVLNALLPIFVTLLGIVIEVREEQPRNASSPILVTLFGILVF